MLVYFKIDKQKERLMEPTKLELEDVFNLI